MTKARKNKITLMIVPHAVNSMKSVSITINLLKVAAAACCVLIALGVVVTWRYYQAKNQLLLLPQLQKVNAENKQQIENTNQELTEIKEKMKQVEELEQDVRKSLGLKESAKVESDSPTILLEQIPFYRQNESLSPLSERTSLTSRGGVTRVLPAGGSERTAGQGAVAKMSSAESLNSRPDGSKLPQQSEIEQLKQELDLRIKGLQEVKSTIAKKNEVRQSTPSIWPVAGRISSSFGYRRAPVSRGSTYHEGIDIAAPKGTPVRATADGTVIFSGVKSGYGNVVMIRHSAGYTTLYGHNSQNKVKVGQTVKKGQTIALCGSTGRSTGPHVHYEVRVNGRLVDPRKYL